MKIKIDFSIWRIVSEGVDLLVVNDSKVRTYAPDTVTVKPVTVFGDDVVITNIYVLPFNKL